MFGLPSYIGLLQATRWLCHPSFQVHVFEPDMIDHVFVYGTLKRGQIREAQWPLLPLSVEPAWTYGKLYDTGPYPAMVDGTDRVAGQVWGYRTCDLSPVLRTLDIIEGTNQPGQSNDYDRVYRECFLRSGESVQAYLYCFARRELLGRFEYILPQLSWGQQRYSVWPTDAEWD